jgi:capsular polysaccharide biosynthesis protein
VSRRPGAAGLRASIAVGLVVALVLAAAGAFYAFSQQRTWVAESMVVVLPSTALDEATSASYYETLSRGQIVATFAEVAGTQRFEQQAEDQLRLSAAERSLVSTEVSVVPDTAVILIRSTAGDARIAQEISRVTTSLSVTYLGGLTQPYRAVTVPSGSTAEPTGMSPWVLAAAGLMAGLVAGLAVQQAVYHLSAAVRGSRAEPQPMSPEPQPMSPEPVEGRSSTGSDRMAPAEEDATAAARRSVPAPQ